MTFLSPAILGALAAASLPVIIHLLNKTRVREVRWAAMRFLLGAVKKNERRIRIEDLLLLLLRILLIALLAIAFARPALLGPPGLGGGGPAAVMLVIDHSLSMGYNDGTGTRLEEAKSEAASVLDALGVGSSAGLILASDQADSVIASPTDDLSLVRRRVGLASQSARAADLFPGVQAAVAGLRDSAHQRKEIHIFTDDQQAAWSRSDEIAALAASNPSLRWVHHPLGGRETANLTVTAIAPGVAIPSAGENTPILTTVRNSGEEEVQGLRLLIHTDGERPENEAVIDRLGPGESRTIPLQVLYPSTGWQTATASLPPDRLPMDNSRALALRVPVALRLLFVGDNANDGTPFFLRNALRPVRADLDAEHPLQIDTGSAVDLATKELADYSLIALTSGASLPDESRRKLEEWVRAGGKLLLFPADAQGVNPPGVVIPGYGQRQESPGGGFPLKSTGFHHPVTTLWNDSAIGGFQSVRFLQRSPLQAPADTAEPTTLLQFSDDSPALIEFKIDRGQVIAAAFALDSNWGNLQLSPSFVPLMQRLAGYLIGESGMAAPVSPGGTFQTVVPKEFLGRPFTVRTPGSNSRVAGGVVEEVNETAVVVYRETKTPGAYTLYLEDQDSPLATFAVQSPPDAGLLDYASEQAIAAALSGEGVATPDETPSQVAMEPSIRFEFWFALILVVALLSLLELAMAHKFSVAK